MQTKEHLEKIAKNLPSEILCSKVFLKTTCSCGKNFYVDADEIGLKNFCGACVKLLENKNN